MLKGMLRGRWGLRRYLPSGSQGSRKVVNTKFESQPTQERLKMARTQPLHSLPPRQAGSWHMQQTQRNHLQSLFQTVKAGDSQRFNTAAVSSVGAGTSGVAGQQEVLLHRKTQVNFVLCADGIDDDDDTMFKVVGETTSLGNWEVSEGVVLQKSSSGWIGHVLLESGAYEFKVLKLRGGSTEWETGANRSVQVPDMCGSKGGQEVRVTCHWSLTDCTKVELTQTKLVDLSSQAAAAGTNTVARTHADGLKPSGAPPGSAKRPKATKAAVQDALSRANQHLAALSRKQQMLQQRMHRIWERTKEQEELYSTLLARMPPDMLDPSAGTPAFWSQVRPAADPPMPFSPELLSALDLNSTAYASASRHSVTSYDAALPAAAPRRRNAPFPPPTPESVTSSNQGWLSSTWHRSPPPPLSPLPPAGTSSCQPSALPSYTPSYSIAARFPGFYHSQDSSATELEPVTYSFPKMSHSPHSQPSQITTEQTTHAASNEHSKDVLDCMASQLAVPGSVQQSGAVDWIDELGSSPAASLNNSYREEDDAFPAREELPAVVFTFDVNSRVEKHGTGSSMPGDDDMIAMSQRQSSTEHTQYSWNCNQLGVSAVQAGQTAHEDGGRGLNVSSSSGLCNPEAGFYRPDERVRLVELEPITFTFLPDGSVNVTPVDVGGTTKNLEDVPASAEVDDYNNGLVPYMGTDPPADWAPLELAAWEGLLGDIPSTTYSHNVFQSFQEESARNPWYLLPVGASQDELPASPTPSSLTLNPLHMAVEVAESVLRSDGVNPPAAAPQPDPQADPDNTLDLDGLFAASTVGSATAMLTGLLLVNAPNMSSVDLAAGRSPRGDSSEMLSQGDRPDAEEPGARFGLRQDTELMNMVVDTPADKYTTRSVGASGQAEGVEMMPSSSQRDAIYDAPENVMFTEMFTDSGLDKVRDAGLDQVQDDGVFDQGKNYVMLEELHNLDANATFNQVEAITATDAHNDLLDVKRDGGLSEEDVTGLNMHRGNVGHVADVGEDAMLFEGFTNADMAVPFEAVSYLEDSPAHPVDGAEEKVLGELLEYPDFLNDLDLQPLHDSKQPLIDDDWMEAFDLDGDNPFFNTPSDPAAEDWMAAFDINGSNPFNEQLPASGVGLLQDALRPADNSTYDFLEDAANDAVTQALPIGMESDSHIDVHLSFDIASELMGLQQGAVLRGTADTLPAFNAMLQNLLPSQATPQQMLLSSSDTVISDPATTPIADSGLIQSLQSPVALNPSAEWPDSAGSAHDPSLPDDDDKEDVTSTQTPLGAQPSGPGMRGAEDSGTTGDSPMRRDYNPTSTLLGAWLNELAASSAVLEPDFVYTASLTDDDLIAEKFHGSFFAAAGEDSPVIDLEQHVYMDSGSEPAAVVFGDVGQLLPTPVAWDNINVSVELDSVAAGAGIPGAASWQLATVVLELHNGMELKAYVEGVPAVDLDDSTDVAPAFGVLGQEEVGSIAGVLMDKEKDVKGLDWMVSPEVPGGMQNVRKLVGGVKARVFSQMNDSEVNITAGFTDALEQISRCVEESRQNLNTLQEEIAAQVNSRRAQVAAQLSTAQSDMSTGLDDLQNRMDMARYNVAKRMASRQQEVFRQWESAQQELLSRWESTETAITGQVEDTRGTVSAQVLEARRSVTAAAVELVAEVKGAQVELGKQVEDLRNQFSAGLESTKLKVSSQLQDVQSTGIAKWKDVQSGANAGVQDVQEKIGSAQTQLACELNNAQLMIIKQAEELQQQALDAKSAVSVSWGVVQRSAVETRSDVSARCSAGLEYAAGTVNSMQGRIEDMKRARAEDMKRSVAGLQVQVESQLSQAQTKLEFAQHQLESRVENAKQDAAGLQSDLLNQWQTNTSTLDVELRKVCEKLGAQVQNTAEQLDYSASQSRARMRASQAEMKQIFEFWLAHQLQAKSWPASGWREPHPTADDSAMEFSRTDRSSQAQGTTELSEGGSLHDAAASVPMNSAAAKVRPLTEADDAISMASEQPVLTDGDHVHQLSEVDLQQPAAAASAPADSAGEVDVSALSDAQLAQLEAVLESTACFAAFYQQMQAEQQQQQPKQGAIARRGRADLGSPVGSAT